MESYSQGEVVEKQAAVLCWLPNSGLTTMCLCSDSGSSGANIKVKSKKDVPAATDSGHT